LDSSDSQIILPSQL